MSRGTMWAGELARVVLRSTCNVRKGEPCLTDLPRRSLTDGISEALAVRSLRSAAKERIAAESYVSASSQPVTARVRFPLSHGRQQCSYTPPLPITPCPDREQTLRSKIYRVLLFNFCMKPAALLHAKPHAWMVSMVVTAAQMTACIRCYSTAGS